MFMKKLLFLLFVLLPYTVVGQVVVPMERLENGLYLIPCTNHGDGSADPFYQSYSEA